MKLSAGTRQHREGDDRSWKAGAVPEIYRVLKEQLKCKEIIEIGTVRDEQKDFDVLLDGKMVVAIRINGRPKNTGEINFYIGDEDLGESLALQNYLFLGWPCTDRRIRSGVNSFLIGDLDILRSEIHKAHFHYDRDCNCIATIKLIALPSEFVVSSGIVSKGTERKGRCIYHNPDDYVDTLMPNGMIRTTCGACSTFVGLRPSTEKKR